MGMKLTWKAMGKRLNLTRDDLSSSSSDDEEEEDSGDEVSLEDEVGTDVGSLTKGKASQLMQKMTTTWEDHIWVTLTKIKGHKESMLTRLTLQSSSMISRPLPMLGSHYEGRKDSKMVVCKRRASWQNSMGEMIQMVWVRQCRWHG